MSTYARSEQEITDEAIQLLKRHFTPPEMARLAIAWRLGSGDYTKERDALFEGATVDSLSDEVIQLREAKRSSAATLK
jgi:hypothetical protein